MDNLFIGSPGSSDLDSISVTSTVPSEPQEEYALDGILAERDNEGEREYLVKWHGYSDLRSTWEAEENFRNDMTIPEWEKRKLRIVQGTEAPFDVAELESRIESENAEIENRKARRRAKRKKLGIRAAVKEPEDLSEYDGRVSKASSEDEGRVVPVDNPPPSATRRRRRRQQEPSTSTDAESEDDVPLIRQAPHRRKKGIAVKLKKSSRSRIRANKNDVTFISSDDDDSNNKSRDEIMVMKEVGPSTVESLPANIQDKSAMSKEKETLPRSSTKEIGSLTTEPLPGNIKIKSAMSKKEDTMPDPSTNVRFGAKKKKDSEHTSSLSLPKSAMEKTQSAKDTGPASARVISATNQIAKPRLPFMVNNRGPARSINRAAHKSAPSSGRPEVTGSAIFNNWSKEAKRPGPWQTRAREPPKASENKVDGQPKTLSWQNKYQKGGRNELAPNIDQLSLFNPKDVPQNRKNPDLSVNTTEAKRPFQMIQDDLVKTNPRPRSTATEGVGGDDPMRATDQLLVADTHVESPMALDADQSLGLPELHKTQYSQGDTNVDIEGSVPDPWLIEHQIQNQKDPRVGIGDLQSVLPATSMSSTIPTGPRRMLSERTSLQTSDHRKSYTIPKTSRSEIIKDLCLAAPKIAKPSETTEESTSKRNQDLLDSRANPSPSNFDFHPTERSEYLLTRSEQPRQEISQEPAISQSNHSIEQIVKFGDSHKAHEADPSEASRIPERTATRSFFPNLSLLRLNQIDGDRGMVSKLNTTHHDLSDVYGTIFLGIEHENPVHIKLRGAFRELKAMLMTVKVPPKQVHFWFEHICTADDYKQFFHEDDYIYYGAGHVQAHPQTIAMVNDIANTLKLHSSGGLFFTPNFAMLIYPSGVNSWQMFDDCFTPELPQAALRFIVRTPIKGFVSGKMEVSKSKPADITTAVEPAANTLFRKHYNIEYKNLLPTMSNSTRRRNFFLMYPLDNKTEHDVLVQFLEANNAIIYSSMVDGAWDLFANTSGQHGVLLIHESFKDVFSIPYLSRILRTSVNIFHIDLCPPSPPHPYLTRLFPHGGALLLTDSLILNHPQRTIRILTWFHRFILPTKPAGTWKIATRPRLREWITTLIVERSHLTLENGTPFVEIWQVIWNMVPMELMDPNEGYEIPMDGAPMVSQSNITGFDLEVGLGAKAHDAARIALNDEKLVAWFAGWAWTKCEHIRRFHVVFGAAEEGEAVKKEWSARWNHLWICSTDEAFKFHGIPKWEVESKARQERRRRQSMASEKESN